jgi:hypothetical protein
MKLYGKEEQRWSKNVKEIKTETRKKEKRTKVHDLEN